MFNPKVSLQTCGIIQKLYKTKHNINMAQYRWPQASSILVSTFHNFRRNWLHYRHILPVVSIKTPSTILEQSGYEGFKQMQNVNWSVWCSITGWKVKGALKVQIIPVYCNLVDLWRRKSARDTVTAYHGNISSWFHFPHAAALLHVNGRTFSALNTRASEFRIHEEHDKQGNKKWLNKNDK